MPRREPNVFWTQWPVTSSRHSSEPRNIPCLYYLIDLKFFLLLSQFSCAVAQHTDMLKSISCLFTFCDLVSFTKNKTQAGSMMIMMLLVLVLKENFRKFCSHAGCSCALQIVRLSSCSLHGNWMNAGEITLNRFSGDSWFGGSCFEAVLLMFDSASSAHLSVARCRKSFGWFTCVDNFCLCFLIPFY